MNKWKRSIINETLSYNWSADEDELSSTEEEKSECAIKKPKYAKDEVPYDVTKYYNAFHEFEYGRNILDRLHVSYERACMMIQSTISDYAYYNSEEQVDAINDSKEWVDIIRDSDKLVDTMSEARAYRDYSFKNEFETMNVFLVGK